MAYTGTMSHRGRSHDSDRHSSTNFLKSGLTHENTKNMQFCV